MLRNVICYHANMEMIKMKVIEIKDGFMTVGELARQMGVTVRTLQYYDREAPLKALRLEQRRQAALFPKGYD